MGGGERGRDLLVRLVERDRRLARTCGGRVGECCDDGKPEHCNVGELDGHGFSSPADMDGHLGKTPVTAAYSRRDAGTSDDGLVVEVDGLPYPTRRALMIGKALLQSTSG